MQRVVVAGCAGSGKSTLARELAARTGLPLTERDGLGVLGSPQYKSAISQMAAGSRWILDGAPYYADEMVYSAADTVIFLDYPKRVVMWRVLRRTLGIELFRRPAGAHKPQSFAAWRYAGHPVRWAWTSHHPPTAFRQTARSRRPIPWVLPAGSRLILGSSGTLTGICTTSGICTSAGNSADRKAINSRSITPSGTPSLDHRSRMKLTGAGRRPGGSRWSWP
jgi:hypothetical protein